MRRIWGGLLAAALIVTGLSAAPAGAATKVTPAVDVGSWPYGALTDGSVWIGTAKSEWQAGSGLRAPAVDVGSHDTLLAVESGDHYASLGRSGVAIAGGSVLRLDIAWAPVSWSFVDASGRPSEFDGWWRCVGPQVEDQAGGRLRSRDGRATVAGMPVGAGWTCWVARNRLDEFSGRVRVGEGASLVLDTEGGDLTVRTPDTTAPVVTGRTTVRPNRQGWHRGPVRVRWSVTDDSGAALRVADTVLRAQGERTVRTDWVRDAAGNAGRGSLTVRIDRTKPTVRVRGVRQGATYRKGAVPARRCGASDRLSGLAKACRVTTTGGDRRGLGRFTRTAVAVDRAGNKAVARVSFVVRR
ncbi:hypothetical protein [Nocardioides aequoreus]|uniref:hypothetical protein n=1 Tax=Nocardioides aequoreus TaxID=397278 RepID=UPI0012F62D97|nr:hypothetical protein [Nocardioides aequoreus]